MLRKSFSSDYGSTHSGAVHEICKISIDKKLSIARMVVCTWVTENARLDEHQPVYTRTYKVEGTAFNSYFADNILNVSTVNPFTKGYEYLQTLDEFDGAVLV